MEFAGQLRMDIWLQ
nr:unnamed protein product [Callosobruchus chinensis]